MDGCEWIIIILVYIHCHIGALQSSQIEALIKNTLQKNLSVIFCAFLSKEKVSKLNKITFISFDECADNEFTLCEWFFSRLIAHNGEFKLIFQLIIQVSSTCKYFFNLLYVV